MNNKIDFVIAWVDGNDKEWQKEKNKYNPNPSIVDCRENRYRDWENLKYLFRGIEKYASWVNKVFFITCGHLPNWLNTNNNKLVIVNHKDYIPEQYLPTFSANPIELNLHRIKDLSENFVYFNDDMFILKNVLPEDFFCNNKPCDSAILSPIISYDKDGFAKLVQNNMAIINTYFIKNECIKKNFTKWINFKYGKELLRSFCMMPWKHFTGFMDIHIPTSLKKETYKVLWDKEFDILNNTSMSKFRNNNIDVNQWLIRYWQLCSGDFVPRSIKFCAKFQYTENNEKLYNSIIHQKYKVICLNDIVGKYDFEKEKIRTIEAFEKILPEKCSFEK